MGLFGKGKKPNATPSHASLSGETEVMVVGTEHYGNLSGIKRGQVPQVTVVPEPRNEYDSNAVAVHFRGARVGYLSAFQAKRYRPMIDREMSVEAQAGAAAGGGLHLFVMLPDSDLRNP